MPPRTASLFKSSDIAKAIAAVEKAGKKVTRVEIGRDGGIVMGCQDLESIEPHARDLRFNSIGSRRDKWEGREEPT